MCIHMMCMYIYYVCVHPRIPITVQQNLQKIAADLLFITVTSLHQTRVTSWTEVDKAEWFQNSYIQVFGFQKRSSLQSEKIWKDHNLHNVCKVKWLFKPSSTFLSYPWSSWHWNQARTPVPRSFGFQSSVLQSKRSKRMGSADIEHGGLLLFSTVLYAPSAMNPTFLGHDIWFESFLVMALQLFDLLKSLDKLLTTRVPWNIRSGNPAGTLGGGASFCQVKCSKCLLGQNWSHLLLLVLMLCFILDEVWRFYALCGGQLFQEELV